MGRVLEYLTERFAAGPVHFTLIDPEKTDGPGAAALARDAVGLGSDAIMLGGSTGIARDRIGEVARSIRTAVRAPTILFPEGPGSLSADADAIYFMSLLNSRHPDFLVRRQARAALQVRALGLETLPLGYIVVAPGMRVGEVGQADPVARDDLDGAAGYALAAQYLGMRMVYLEAGSGAPAPVPPPMVRRVREVLAIPLLVGGGIRRGTDARTLLDAGAQGLVTGTVTEEEKGIGPGFREILAEVRRGRSG